MKRIPMCEVQVNDVVRTDKGLGRVVKVQPGFMQPEFARLDCELRDGQSHAVILRSDKEVALHYRPYQGSAKSWYQFLTDTQEQLDNVDILILRLQHPRDAEDKREAGRWLRAEIPALTETLEKLLLSLSTDE